MTRTRRALLRAALAGSAAGLSGCELLGSNDDQDAASSCQYSVGEQSSENGADPPVGAPESLPDAVGLEPVAEGFEAPLDIVFPPGDGLGYVATQPGRVFVVGPEGRCQDPLLDLSDEVVVGTEQGLLGIELHPSFASNRRLFVRYSSPPRDGTPDEYSHSFVLAEFEVNDAGTRVRVGSQRIILEIPQPQDTHNAGAIEFGPDGYLYVPTGDGGGHVDADPGHAEDWHEPNDGGNGQDVTENLLGSILRIDVDSESADRAYAVPSDNPLVGRGGIDEQWAWGFRNPWRLSFDGEDLYVADVGKWRREEVDLVEKGGNYGWNVREGTDCFDTADPGSTREDCPDRTPADVRGGERLIDPIVDYFHTGDEEDVNGIAVISGNVYRGSSLPGLWQRYVFADLEPKGRLFVATPPGVAGEADWTARTLELTDDAAERLTGVLSIARDDGELYALGGGGVYRLRPAQ